MENILILGEIEIEKYWSLKDYNLICIYSNYASKSEFDALVEKYSPVFVINTFSYAGNLNDKERNSRNLHDHIEVYQCAVEHNLDYLLVSPDCSYDDSDISVYIESRALFTRMVSYTIEGWDDKYYLFRIDAKNDPYMLVMQIEYVLSNNHIPNGIYDITPNVGLTRGMIHDTFMGNE
jgi:hypothetical protein